MTDDDLRILARALAEAYVDTVEGTLKKWPGARPKKGSSWGMVKEFYGFERTDREIANAPVCVDWCNELCTEMAGKLGQRKVNLSGGTFRLNQLVGVKWGQQWNLVGEHNFPILYPVGQIDASGNPVAYSILDAWVTLLPDVAPQGKYRTDVIAGPFAGARGAAQARKAEEARRRPPRPAYDYDLLRIWPGGSKPGACFVGGTLIGCPDGFRRIEYIRPGDTVLSWDPSTSQLLSTRVTKLDVHKGHYDLLTLRLSTGDEVQVTPDHPFYEGGAWVTSSDLARFGRAFGALGGRVQVLSATLLRDQETTVFNVQTETGTYVVGRTGLVVSGRVVRNSDLGDGERRGRDLAATLQA